MGGAAGGLKGVGVGGAATFPGAGVGGDAGAGPFRGVWVGAATGDTAGRGDVGKIVGSVVGSGEIGVESAASSAIWWANQSASPWKARRWGSVSASALEPGSVQTSESGSWTDSHYMPRRQPALRNVRITRT